MGNLCSCICCCKSAVVGTMHASYDSENPNIIQNYRAPIYKSCEGVLYVDDNWFGKFILSPHVKENDIVQTSPTRWGKITFL